MQKIRRDQQESQAYSCYPQYVSAEQVRQRIMKERENEVLKEKITLQETWEQQVRNYNEMEIQADRKHRNNANADITAEIVQTNQLHQTELQNRQLTRRMQQDEQLANELARRNAEENMKLRDVQRICEEDDELRELQEKLKTAYVTKERALQVKDKQFQLEQEKEMEYQEYLREERHRRLENIKEEEKEAIRHQQMVDAKNSIEQQMRDKQLRIETDAAAVAAHEKAQIDDIMNNIRKEDEAVMREKYARQAKIQEFIKQYIHDRDVRKSRARQDEKEEMDRIYREAAISDEKSKLVQKYRDEIQARRDALYQRICLDANKKLEEDREMEKFRELLYIEEEEEKLRELDRQTAERRARILAEVMKANEESQAMKAEKIRKEREEEEQIGYMMKKKFEEDLRKEREEFERRQQEKILYRGQINDQIKRRQEAYAIELERERFEIEQNKRREEFKKHVVEEARRRLLEQHAVELNQYLPKGVIQNPEEYNLVYGNH